MSKQLTFITLCCAIAMVPHIVSAAVLGYVSSRSQVAVGDTVSVRAVVTSDTPVNAIGSSVVYDSQKLKLTGIVKEGSIINLWVEEPVSFASGEAHFEGVIFNPGWSGTNGMVLELRFSALEPGDADISFTNAQILANDGKGTSISEPSRSTRITIVPRQAEPTVPVKPQAPAVVTVQSETHPDQNTVYTNTHVVLRFDLPSGVDSVQADYDMYADGVPRATYTSAITEKAIDLPSGTWYYHIRAHTKQGWGPIQTFTIHIQTAQPIGQVARNWLDPLLWSLLLLAYILGFISHHRMQKKKYNTKVLVRH